MSIYANYAKSAAAVGLLVVAWTIYSASHGITTTGSGGLYASSAGISEGLIDFVLLTAVVWICLWVYRRSGRRKS